MNEKNNNSLDINQKTVHLKFASNQWLSSEKNVERFIDWITFYRRNITVFIHHYLGIRLYLYQIICIHLLNIYSSTAIIAARSAAKSFMIAVYACAKAILYPNSIIVVGSAVKGQGKLIVSAKIKGELMKKSPTLCNEIKAIKDSSNDVEVYFHNGSIIRVVPVLESSLGGRSTVLIGEEFRRIKKQFFDSIMQPFQMTRQSVFRTLPFYEDNDDVIENPINIYISSSGTTRDWMWGLAKELIGLHYKNDSACLLAMDYSIALKHKIKTKDQMEFYKRTFDDITWRIEFENEMFRENTDAYFSYVLMCQNQKLRKSFYPRRLEDALAKKKNSYVFSKQKDEIRVLACDMAFMARKGNDRSAFSIIRALPETIKYVSQNLEGSSLEIKRGYRRSLPYMESAEGEDSMRQAIRIKQLYEDFDCDYIVLDTRNGGLQVYDILAKIVYDEDRDKEYKPWVCINDQEVADRIKINGAEPVLFAITASQKLNSKIAMDFKRVLVDNMFDLLVPYSEAVDDILPKIEEYNKAIANGDNDTVLFYETPFLETQALISETIDLTYERKEQTGDIVISEQGSNTKDKYTSVSYGNYFISLLEQDLLSDNSNYDFDFSDTY